MEVTLKANPRDETGKGPARRSRFSGRVPGVLYGKDLDPLPITIEGRDMLKALATESGLNVLINLQLDSKTKYLTMLREVQRNPIRGDLIHVDFFKIDRDVKIQAEVPVHLIGESRGVKEGGVIEHHLWDLKVEALPGSVPPSIEVNIANLGIGDHVRVSDLKVVEGVDILTPLEEIIASVVEPQIIELPEEIAAAEEEAAAALAEAEGVEGEAAEGEDGERPAAEEGGETSEK